MGETPKITDPLKALEAARAAFEDGADFTIGVEEEFAILAADGLDMTAGFERIDAATRTGPLAGMVAGELIRSEVEVRTGRCESFAEAAETMARRRADVIAAAERLGYRLSATGTHPFARWQDQEVIDTPHYHLVESTLRYVAWRNNTFGIHVHTGIRGADRAIAVTERAALGAAGAPGGVVQLAVARGPPHPPAVDPDADLHPLLPPLRHPRPASSDWDEYDRFVRFLIETRSIREHTEIWWSVRPHQAFPTVEIRICDAPAGVRAVGGAGGADGGALGPLRPRLRRGPAAARASAADARGEPVAGDPLGHDAAS